MSEIRTRDDALDTVSRALAQWAATSSGVFTQAGALVAGAQSSAAQTVRSIQTRIGALRAALSALGPEDDPRPLQQALAERQQAFASAQRAGAEIDAIAQRVTALGRTQARSNEAEVAGARADLVRRFGELGAYRAASVSGGAASSATVPAGTSGNSWLGANGLADIDVNSADIGTNPIIGKFGRGDTTLADYRWAVETWDSVVRPGIDRGMTRDDFVARDDQRAAGPLRRTADVYDMFLRDPVRVTRLPNGRYDVTGGRHRLEVARQLGVTRLPAQVHEL